jgi:hypothetical protein
MFKPLSVGTTSVLAYSVPVGMKAKITIQNLSANNVYLLEGERELITQGFRLVSGAHAEDDTATGEIWLLADGLASDVRFQISNIRRLEMP